MARAQGANATLLGVVEAEYGTAPVNGWRKLPFVSHSLGGEQPLVDDDTLGFGRDPLPPGYGDFKADGDVVAPLDLRGTGWWLTGLLGAPTTTVNAGVYTHVWGSGEAALPSRSFEAGLPEAGSFRVQSGALINTLKLPIQTSGNVSATWSMIAQGETEATETVDATPDAYVYKRFQAGQGAVTLDGVALGSVVSGEMTYSNNLDPAKVVRGDNKIDGIDLGKTALGGSLVMRFSSTALLNKATTKTPVVLSFRYQISASAALVVAAHEVYLPRPKTPVSGPGGVQATFNWQASRQTGGGRMATFILINDAESYA
jgi:hypothetical protein